MIYSTYFTGESLDGWMYNKQGKYVVGRWITNGRHTRSKDVPGEEESGREVGELTGRAGSWGGLHPNHVQGTLGRSCAG